MQTWLLYHNALSAGVAIEDVLKYARTNKEKRQTEADLIHDLRAQVQEQDRVLKMLSQAAAAAGMSMDGAAAGGGSGGGGGGAGSGERSALMGSARGPGYGATSPAAAEMSIEMGDLASRGVTAALPPRRAPEAVSGLVGSKTVPINIPTLPTRSPSGGSVGSVGNGTGSLPPGSLPHLAAGRGNSPAAAKSPSLSGGIALHLAAAEGRAATAAVGTAALSLSPTDLGRTQPITVPRSGSGSSTGSGSIHVVVNPVPRSSSRSFLGNGLNREDNSHDSLEGAVPPTPDQMRGFVFSQPAELPPRQGE